MIQNQNFKSITAWVAMSAIVFVLLFSTCYIVEHADHECTGRDCPICLIMEQCGNNLKSIGTAIMISCVAVVLFSSLQENKHYQISMFPCNSLVSQKIRMNN